MVKLGDEGKASQSFIGTLPDQIEPQHLDALNEGLRFVLEQLREASRLYRSADNGGRDGATYAVEIVSAFMTLFRTVIDERLQAPFVSLVSALNALENNIVEPLLRPSPHSGRALSGELRDVMKGTAAFTVRRLCDIGLKPADAHEAVANTLSKLNIKPGRGSNKIVARTVRGWCEEISRDTRGERKARQVFDLLLADPRSSEIDGLTHLEAQRMLLRRLADTISSTRAADVK